VASSESPARKIVPDTTVLPPPVIATQTPAQDRRFILNVQRQDGSAILGWDPESAAVRDADHALLTIEDGPNRKQLHINKPELETGQIVYIPRGSDVAFRMQVFASAGSTTRSIRSTARLSGDTRSGKDSRAKSPTLTNLPAKTEEAAVSPPQESPATTPAPLPSPAPTRQPFAASGSAGSNLQTNLQKRPDPAPRRPAEPHVATTVWAEFVTHTGLKGVLSGIFHSGSDNLIPPRVVRQVLPDLSPPVAATIRTQRQIDVKITVGGDRGEVYKAELADRRLADPVGLSVLSAARQWNFEPARANGRPMEAKVVLHFFLRRTG
jgi:outer membrane biosynthesis protein TonB